MILSTTPATVDPSNAVFASIGATIKYRKAARPSQRKRRMKSNSVKKCTSLYRYHWKQFHLGQVKIFIFVMSLFYLILVFYNIMVQKCMHLSVLLAHTETCLHCNSSKHHLGEAAWKNGKLCPLAHGILICAMVKSRYIGDGHPTFHRNPYNGYINPYYWVDDHPLLYGNNGSLDPGTYQNSWKFERNWCC